MSGLGTYWPDGLSEEIAVVGVSIDYIESILNISFNDDFDDLDSYKYYVFKFEEGYCALMRYKNAQTNGITLIIQKDHLVRLDDSLSYFLGMLRLTDCPIIWRRDAPTAVAPPP